MSDALTAAAEGVSAISLNPAGVLDSSVTTLHLTHAFYVAGMSEDYLAFSRRLPFGSGCGVSLHGLYDSSTGRTLEDENGNYAGEAGNFPVAFAVVSGAYAINLASFLGAAGSLDPTAGVGLRAVWQKLDRESWLGMAVDLGFKVRPGAGFIVGGVLQNAGVVRGPSGMPLQWVTGLAWQGMSLLRAGDRVLVEVDTPVAVDRRLLLRAGTEYRMQFNRIILALRGGWKQENEVPGAPGIAAGFGFRWFPGRTPWGMDYAYIPWGVFGAQHAIALTIGLVPPPPPTNAAVEREEREEIFSFYPLKGEKASFGMVVNEPGDLSAQLLDEDGNPIMTLIEKQTVEPGTVEVSWDGRLPNGMYAMFELTYRIMIQFGSQTLYRRVVPRKEQ
jgi:hypothetical protein